MKQLPLGYYSTFQPDRRFWLHLPQNHKNHKAKLEVICLQNSYSAPSQRGREKRNWLWQRLSLMIALFLQYISSSQEWKTQSYSYKLISPKVSCCRVKGKQIEMTSAFSEVWSYNVLCVFRAPANIMGFMGPNVCSTRQKSKLCHNIQNLQNKMKMQGLHLCTAFDRLPQWALNLVAVRRHYHNRNI